MDKLSPVVSPLSSAARRTLLEYKRQRLQEVRARLAERKRDQKCDKPAQEVLYNAVEIDTLLQDVQSVIATYEPDVHTCIEITPPPETPKKSPPVILTFSEILSIDIPSNHEDPKICYPKFTQTGIDDDQSSESNFSILDFDTWHDLQDPLVSNSSLESPIDQDQELTSDFIAQQPIQLKLQKSEQFVDQALSDEEKNEIRLDPHFQQFVFQAAKIVMRALSDPNSINVDIDYCKPVTVDPNIPLALQRKFEDVNLTQNRSITGISFHTVNKELFAVSYGPVENNYQASRGLVIVWNTKFKSDMPEFVLTSNLRLTSVVYACGPPYVLVAGAYSGQICVWDTTANNEVFKKPPSQMSSFSLISHALPVFSMVVRESENACKLFSASTDGRFCSWSLDNIQKPLTSKDIRFKLRNAHHLPDQLTILCMDMSNIDSNCVCLGCDDGRVFKMNASQPSLTEDIIYYPGHNAGVCSLQLNRSRNEFRFQGVDFSDLFVTSSFDWTIRIWSIKETGCIYSIEDHADVVTAVAWSPANPAILASVDARGWLLIHNLAIDRGETCVARVRVSESFALVKLSFSETGEIILVGDSNGTVFEYHQISDLVTPKLNDLRQMEQNLKEWRRLSKNLENPIFNVRDEYQSWKFNSDLATRKNVANNTSFRRSIWKNLIGEKNMNF